MMFSDIDPNKYITEDKDKAEELSAEQLRKKKQREYYKANKKRIRKHIKKYYEANRTKMIDKMKEYNEKNKDKIKAYRDNYYVTRDRSEWYQENKERINQRKKDRRGTLRGTLNEVFLGARGRAKKKGIEFDLTRKWLSEKVIDFRCEATDYPFNIKFKVKKTRPYAPSIHRLDPNKGYTRDNCAVVCWAWNRMVGDSTDGITQTLIKSFIEKTKKEARESKKACPKTPSLFSSLDNAAQKSSDGSSSKDAS